jgi:hypothetical protein
MGAPLQATLYPQLIPYPLIYPGLPCVSITCPVRISVSGLWKAHELLVPGGRLFHSEWQFLNSARLRARLQPWERIGLAEDEVEPGDYLMDWRHGGYGLRYVHHFSTPELADLAAETGFSVKETFLSDGAGGQLGLYQSWEKL